MPLVGQNVSNEKRCWGEGKTSRKLKFKEDPHAIFSQVKLRNCFHFLMAGTSRRMPRRAQMHQMYKIVFQPK